MPPGVCSMGDTAIVQGKIYSTKSFNDASVTLQPCVLGYCPPQASVDAGSLCDDWLTPTSGQDCGESGTYAVYNTVDIPQNDDIPQTFIWFVRSTVLVKMILGYSEDCEDQADNSYSLSYAMDGFAGLAMVGYAAYSSWRKHTSRGDCDEDKDVSRFVEMGGLAVV